MNTCGSCFGSGKVTCPSCGGRRNESRFGLHGVEVIPCAVCYGRGRVRCNFCGGRGEIFPTRIPGTAGRQGLDAERQKLRDTMQKMYNNTKNSGVTAALLSAILQAFEQTSNYSLRDLGLPIEKINRLSNAQNQTALNAAYDDLMSWLFQAGWIKD